VRLHTFPIPTFYSEVAAAVCWLTLALAILVAAWRSESGLRLPKIALAPAGLIGALFLQLQFAPPLNPFFSLVAVAFLLAAVLACGLGAYSRKIPGAVESLAVGLVLGGVLTFGVELVQLFRVQGLPFELFSTDLDDTGRRLSGNLNQPNHADSYLAMGLAACLLLANKWRSWRWPLAVVVLALLLGMSLTFSRTAWLHLAMLGLLSGWVILTTDAGVQGARKWLKATAPLVCLLVVYQLCNWLVAYANLRWHFDLQTSLAERMAHGVSDRLPIWRHGWHMLVTHPWFGAGWADFAWNQYLQTDTLGQAMLSTNAHNLILDLLAKAGVIGLLAVFLPLGWLAIVALRRPITREKAFFYALILILVGHSMLEYPLHYLYFLLPFAFALGYVDESRLRFPSPAMTSTLTLAMALGSVAVLPHLWGDYRAIERLQYSPQGLAKELALYAQHGPTLLIPYENFALASNWVVTPSNAAAAAKLELQAMQFNPGAATVLRYAVALAYLGKTDEAVHQVRRVYMLTWLDYDKQSWLITQLCHAKVDGLKTFCERLRDENLLVEMPAASEKTSSPASQ
jgi:O-antigen ligase